MLVVCAAWSSSISLGEPMAAWLVERGLGRGTAALAVGLAAWLLGVGSVLSFNVWKEHEFLVGTFFDNIEFLSTSVMLPLGGLLIAIFAGWVMKETHARKELAMKSFPLYLIWRALVRVVSPTAVIALFIYSLWSVLAADDGSAEAGADGDSVEQTAPADQETR